MTVTSTESYEVRAARERREEFARTVEFREIVRKVADHLPGKWRYDTESNKTRYRAVNLLGPIEGMGLHFSMNYDSKGKVAICGNYPSGWYRDHTVDRSSIGVSLSRGVETIAAAVQRRLLPGYLVEFERLANAAEERKRIEDANEAAGKRIADALYSNHNRGHCRRDSAWSSTGYRTQGFTHRLVIESGASYYNSDHEKRDQVEVGCCLTVDDLTVEEALALADQFRVEGYVPPEPERVCEEEGE